MERRRQEMRCSQSIFYRLSGHLPSGPMIEAIALINTRQVTRMSISSARNSYHVYLANIEASIPQDSVLIITVNPALLNSAQAQTSTQVLPTTTLHNSD